MSAMSSYASYKGGAGTLRVWLAHLLIPAFAGSRQEQAVQGVSLTHGLKEGFWNIKVFLGHLPTVRERCYVTPLSYGPAKLRNLTERSSQNSTGRFGAKFRIRDLAAKIFIALRFKGLVDCQPLFL